ncbi:MAG: glycosyltransferase [Nitrospira sp.]|nr:glycosyltransferase [Nitrospira sp.]
MIHIVLPAYNEEAALRPLLAKIDKTMNEQGWPYRVVIVNDGSQDRTGEILEELRTRYPMHVIGHRYNRGLGETIRDGFEYVGDVAAPDDILVRMDCDDTHEPKHIAEMVKKLNEGYEVVTTSRYAPGGGQTGLDWYRRTISRCANLLFKFVFPVPGLKEYTCGYRAYRVGILQDALHIFGNKFIDLKGLGFTGTLEKLIKFRMLGARIGEVPFVLRYEQKLSTSKVVTSITTLGCFILIIKHCRNWGGNEGVRWARLIKERQQRVAASKSHAVPGDEASPIHPSADG